MSFILPKKKKTPRKKISSIPSKAKQFQTTCQNKYSFRLNQILGKGSFGITYVSCTNDKCKYAAKIQLLDDNIQPTPKNIERVKNEADIQYYLNDSGISSEIYDDYLCSIKRPDKHEELYSLIILELYDGSMEKFKWKNTNDKVNFIHVLLKLVDILHRKYYVAHKDIKLKNIFFKKDGTIVLGDFGVSERYDSYDDGLVGYNLDQSQVKDVIDELLPIRQQKLL
uniref:non-specific serine/threonine protein kinase n=1 Tax=Marseillevirus LCMAC102 TaxID=2506603 RepID=A0A481YT36_9VIRU|nr:MAG: protein kinase [Marseillevirus LCMAC102]